MATPLIQRALISVSDKTGLVPLARLLTERGVQIFSTGGTRAHLREAGLPVEEVAAYTQFPEMLDGRLKTLHPKVFGGILARHDRQDDLARLGSEKIVTFELVVVNLYPFERTVADPEVSEEEAIEQIDIGGPSLVRAAAKNFAFVTIATDPGQYPPLMEEIAEQGGTTRETRRQLAAAAFARTAAYDRAISAYFQPQTPPTAGDAPATPEFPATLARRWVRRGGLRYGENPHQAAALYEDPEGSGSSLLQARQLHGKELSYNNYLDLDAALALVRGFSSPAAAVIKHNNPCGVATAATLADATHAALQGDPVSAFGSILGLNRQLDQATAELLCEPGLFVEAIVAPAFASQALELLTRVPKWKQNVRLMELGAAVVPAARVALRPIDGGLLVQVADDQPDVSERWQVVTCRPPTDEELQELAFAWSVVRHLQSNAIALTRQRALVGAGAGQMSRVDAVEIAIRKAGQRSQGSVLASDAFFPFPDSIHQAAAAGVTAIIQPGGSRQDDAVIQACDAHGLAMVFTGRRHFKH